MNANVKVALIIDDSDSDRFFISRILKKMKPDVELHEFAYAQDALSFLRSPDRPQADLLVVDINMPRMDGFEFADAYHALYPELRGNAPVFITSSSLNPADRERAAQHPCVSGFLEKPITREALDALFVAAAA